VSLCVFDTTDLTPSAASKKWNFVHIYSCQCNMHHYCTQKVALECSIWCCWLLRNFQTLCTICQTTHRSIWL